MDSKDYFDGEHILHLLKVSFCAPNSDIFVLDLVSNQQEPVGNEGKDLSSVGSSYPHFYFSTVLSTSSTD